MNAAQMVSAKIEQLDDAKGNHSDTRLMRDITLFLESVSIQMEKDDQRLAKGLKQVNSFRVVENMANKRIIELEEIKEMNLDPSSKKPDPRYREHEQY